MKILGEMYRANATPPAEPFSWDTGATAHRVDHFAVASHSNGLVLEVNGTYYDLDVQQAIGLVRLQRAATNSGSPQ